MSSSTDLPNNVWSNEQEKLLTKWADYAACYRWLHDKSKNKYSNYNNIITIPVIVLSTLTGTASIGLSGLAGSDPNNIKYGQIAIGIASLSAGILSTIGSHFRYAQKSENHKIAAIAWRKINRNITDKLSQKVDNDSRLKFINECHLELDKLVEQSPSIPDDVLNSFENEFEKQIVTEMTINLKNKKKILRDKLLPDLDIRMNGLVEKTFKEYEEKIKAVTNTTGTVIDVRKKLDTVIGSDKKENVVVTVT